MQKLLDTCDAYATSYQLSNNATKLFSLCFKPNLIRITPPSFVLGKHVIPAVDTCKYLGITVSETSCDNELKRQMRKYYAITNILLRKLSYCSPDVQCCMFKFYGATMCCPSMWFGSIVTAMKKLKIAYNNGLRRLLTLPKYNSASEMSANLNSPSFGELLLSYTNNFEKLLTQYVLTNY